MKPAAFDYECPTDLDAALAMLAEDRETRILAGGQSLVPMMNYRLATPDRLIDINRLPGLDYIRKEGDEIAIGALARHGQVKASKLIASHFPMIPEAYEWVAHAAVRNRGALCGNLCHADPASEMPVLMQALEASMVLTNASGSRTGSAQDFFLGTYDTVVAPDEMLTELRIPLLATGSGWGFEEVAMRKGDYAWCTVVTILKLKAGRIAEPRIAVAGLADHACRLGTQEAALDGMAPDDALFAEIADAAAEAAAPPDSEQISADYRRDLLRALLPRVLRHAVDRAQA